LIIQRTWYMQIIWNIAPAISLCFGGLVPCRCEFVNFFLSSVRSSLWSNFQGEECSSCIWTSFSLNTKIRSSPACSRKKISLCFHYHFMTASQDIIIWQPQLVAFAWELWILKLTFVELLLSSLCNWSLILNIPLMIST